MCAPVCNDTSTGYTRREKNHSLLVKIGADFSSFDIAKSQYGNQIARSLTSVKEKGI